MKKLSNNGWGLSVMIAFIAFFILAILVIVILAYHVDRDNDIPILDEGIINIELNL